MWLGLNDEFQVLGGYLRRMAAGDPDALAEFYDKTRRRAFGLALRIVGDAASAEEATLDAYDQVWRKADSFDGERGSPLTWLLTITRSRALDHLRKKRRRADRETVLEDSAAFVDAAPRPDEVSAAGEAATLVRAAVGALPPEQRECIEAAYFKGLSYSQVAEARGEPLGTVKTRIRTGMRQLRGVLAEVQL